MGSQSATEDPAATRREGAGTPTGRKAWRLAVTAIVVMVVLVGADRMTAAVTQHRLASRIEKAEHLRRPPEVKIRGFPFLTQALRGRYRTVDIRATDPIVTDIIEVDDAAVTLHDAHVKLSDVAYGTVSTIPVGSGTGHAVVPYSSINAAIQRYGGAAGSAVTVVGANPGGARLQGPLGMSVALTAKVTSGKLVITPVAQDLTALPSPVAALVRQTMAVPVPLPQFPFNVKLAGGSFHTDGLHLTADSKRSVLPVQ